MASFGHAWSPDLRRWTLKEPLTEPGQGFGQLEVPQIVDLDGQLLLIFNCLRKELAARRKATGTTGGVWMSRAASPLGPYDIAGAQQLTDSRLYVGRLVQRRDPHDWLLMAFRNDSDDGSFVGEIADPQPVRSIDGQLIIDLSDPSAD